MQTDEPVRAHHLAAAFVADFPTYDLVFNNDPYSHRDPCLDIQKGELKHGVLGLKGQNTSGNHMILSPRLIQDLPYCYYGPGRVADARFFLLIQNDERFCAATESSLCVSHTKNSADPSHNLLEELSAHIHNEYTYIGYNYALFFLTYVDKFSYTDWDLRKESYIRDQMRESLQTKLPFTLAEEEKTAVYYKTVARGLTLLDRKLRLQKHELYDLDPVISELNCAHDLLCDMYAQQERHILAGIDLFFQTADHLHLWQKITGRTQIHEPVLE
jgi:hypothetical protein